MQTLLARWGVKVMLAGSWDEALALIEQTSPQILLMDYQLSHDETQNGLALIDKIRYQLDAILPAALITATPDEDLVVKCKDQGVNYLSKPLKPAKLRALLQSMTRHIRESHYTDSD